jgi:hypothetical protein
MRLPRVFRVLFRPIKEGEIEEEVRFWIDMQRSKADGRGEGTEGGESEVK